ncbi:MAG: hypothetical protein V1721_03300 [Pseudomonadota bacterium]
MMTRFLTLLPALLLPFAALCANTAHAAATISCTDGNFNSGGAISTQATISGVHNIMMDTAGAITYDAALAGPAVGTNIVCTFSGFDANSIIDRVRCDASRTTTSTGGCCGATNRKHTLFTVRGAGRTTMNETNCLGYNTNVAPCGSGNCFRADAAGGGTLTFGTTMDATHVTIGEDGYLLSNNINGVLNMRLRGLVRGRSTYADSSADWSVAFTSLVGFSGTTDLNFGRSTFTGTPGAGDRVDLGTNGTAVAAGNFALQGGALTAGQVTMNNVQNGVTVEVYCDTTIHLTNAANTRSIDVTGVKVAREGTTGSYASAGSACKGSGGAVAATLVYAAGTTDQFFFGGRLDGGTASGLTGEAYSSANPGGTSMTVVVLSQ